MLKYISVLKMHHSRCSMCIPWLSSVEFEAVVTPRVVPLPAPGLIDLSAIAESFEACMVNVSVDAEMQTMLVSM